MTLVTLTAVYRMVVVMMGMSCSSLMAVMIVVFWHTFIYLFSGRKVTK